MHEKGFAIVTGGSRGLGAAMCERLASDGYNIVLNYVSDSSQEKAHRLIEKMESQYGIDAIAVQADTSDYEQCKKILDAGLNRFGENISVLVNNSGIAGAALFEERKVEDYVRLVNVNLFSVMNNSHLVLPYMIKNKGGNIINLSSVCGLTGWVTQVDYSATKAGIIGFTKALAKEVGHYGIRVNCIAPGQINTDMTTPTPKEAVEENIRNTPLGCYGEPEDIAQCMSYLISANFMTGQVISPNGGQTM